MKSIKKRRKRLGNYNIGEVWWTQFPFEDSDEDKHRPAIVIDDNTIAVLAMIDIRFIIINYINYY